MLKIQKISIYTKIMVKMTGKNQLLWLRFDKSTSTLPNATAFCVLTIIDLYTDRQTHLKTLSPFTHKKENKISNFIHEQFSFYASLPHWNLFLWQSSVLNIHALWNMASDVISYLKSKITAWDANSCCFNYKELSPLVHCILKALCSMDCLY